MNQLVAIKVPDIGDFAEVTVIEILVSVGDAIQPEQSLITVESDKASMEIPASQGGVVKSLKVKIGDKVAEGSVILEVEAAENAAAPDAATDSLTPAQAVATASASACAPAPASYAGSADIECDDCTKLFTILPRSYAIYIPAKCAKYY